MLSRSISSHKIFAVLGWILGTFGAFYTQETPCMNTGIAMSAFTPSILSAHTVNTLFNVCCGIKFTMGVRFKFGPTTDTRCARGILVVQTRTSCFSYSCKEFLVIGVWVYYMLLPVSIWDEVREIPAVIPLFPYETLYTCIMFARHSSITPSSPLQ